MCGVWLHCMASYINIVEPRLCASDIVPVYLDQSLYIVHHDLLPNTCSSSIQLALYKNPSLMKIIDTIFRVFRYKA